MCQDSRRHVAGTVEHVVLCSQGTGDTAPLLLVGLNEESLDLFERIGGQESAHA